MSLKEADFTQRHTYRVLQTIRMSYVIFLSGQIGAIFGNTETQQQKLNYATL